MRTFEIGERDFLLDGAPFRVLSGALHYFRVHPEQWRDRVRKARQMGLNTIETYIPWNAHEPRRGEFAASGQLDLARFLDVIHEEGMWAIVRPGPYICAEWANGGLPSWLFTDATVGVRRNEAAYMEAVSDYFHHIGPIVAPRQIHRGGAVILVQIENEYGAYGADADYLRALVDLNRAVGFDVPFTTVDQPEPEMLENGSLPGLLRTASFGTRALERLETLRRHQPTGPLMCSEFWNGWFDYWGSHHHAQSASPTAHELDQLLSQGASVNLYMFHGGANFGFSNGANDKGIYRPTVTSYSYDAPLDEAGHPTEKYWAFRDVISRYADVEQDAPAAAPERADVPILFQESVPLDRAPGVVGAWTSHSSLPSMDDVERYDGFLLYRTPLQTEAGAVLEFADVRDRAQVLVGGAVVATVSRDSHERAAVLPTAVDGYVIVLVEDQGRVNYGPLIGEHKGLIGLAYIGESPIMTWETAELRLDDAAAVEALFEDETRPVDRHIAGPAFARAVFDLEEPRTADGWIADRYLDTLGLGKGVAWLNGFCLGRYWSRGPQRTLLVPGPLLKEQGNTLTIFEQHVGEPRVRLIDHAELGHTEL
jgi:beta-galactosidase